MLSRLFLVEHKIQMPRILLVAKAAKNGRRRQDVHPKETTYPVVDPRAESRKQKTLAKKSRLREHATKYAEHATKYAEDVSHDTPSRSAAAQFETYILHLKGHVLDLHHAAFTARL